MKFSENWLREWVSPAISTDELVARLTMAGLEVDAVEPASEPLSGVVVGKIVSVEPHPDAEKLRVCLVDGHPEGQKQVVCGAPNARVGLVIPFATVGSVLPEGLKIKKAKLRGVESFGMLCGQTELLLGDDDSGLWELPDDAPVGESLVQWLGLQDQLIEVDLTPNRSDCLSIRGLAREVGVLTDCDVTAPTIPEVANTSSSALPISLSAPQACPNYCGRVIRGVDVSKPSPVWLVERLRRSGIRSIDAIVDVTNYVLLELGQPMHAFDLDKISGGITVRFAKAEEALELLNGQEIALRDDTLVIADDRGALAIAGVMGGSASAVGDTTKNIFLESAFFNPSVIAGKARSYGLHTDSSHRFERGVDWQLQRLAVERATQLITDICGGEVGPVCESVDTSALPVVGTVQLRKERIVQALCLPCEELGIPQIMSRLGLNLSDESDVGWTFSIPSYRFDVAIEEDLIEEVARIYGYDRLPTKSPGFVAALESHSEASSPVSTIKQVLCSRGYQEVITYSFVDPKVHTALFGVSPSVRLKNPISAEMASMRTSMLPGLIQSLSHNLNRQHVRAALFEMGMVFVPQDQSIESLLQTNRIAGLRYGAVEDVHWSAKARDSDFFDLKGDLEALLATAARGREVSFAPLIDVAYLHPGQSATVLIDRKSVGFIGALHPTTAKALNLSKTVWVFECDLTPLLAATVPHFQGLSKYPEVTRDLAFVVDKGVRVSQIEIAIRKVAGDVLKELKLFDVYSGEGIDPKGKSLAFSLVFQLLDRTLTDDEINSTIDAVISELGQTYGATLR